MIFEALESLGEVIKSNPPVEELEEEKFENSFMVTIVSKEEPSQIEAKIMKVSEVEKVVVKEFAASEVTVAEEVTETAPAVQETAVAAVTPSAAPKKKRKNLLL